MKILENTLNISNSNFTNNRNVIGPALSVASQKFPPKITIYQSIFHNNTAYIGGSLAIHSSVINITNSTFSNNVAELYGAAVFLAEVSKEKRIFDRVNFVNNKAKYDGDIGYEAVDFNISFLTRKESDIIVSNKADSLVLENVSMLDFKEAYFILSYKDDDGNPAPDLSSIRRSFLELPHNTKWGFQSTYPSLVEPHAGILHSSISLHSIFIAGKMGTQVQLNLIHSSERVNKSKTVIINLKSCLPGELNGISTCKPCADGTFSLNPNNPCTNCPVHAECPGQSQIVPEEGYWNTNTSSAVILKCREDHLQRCVNHDQKRSCLAGYGGPLCEACDFENGYVEKGYLECGKCEDFTDSLAYIIVIGAAYFALQLFFIFSSVSSPKDENEVDENSPANSTAEKFHYIHSFLTYTQLMSLLYMGSSHIFKNLGLTSHFGDLSTLIMYGTQCSMKVLGVDPKNFIYYQIYAIIATPILQLLVVMLFLMIIKIWKKDLPIIRIIYITILFLIISSQSGIATNLSQFLSCTSQESLDYQYISTHVDWSCETPEYLSIANSFVAPNLFLWCFVFPLVTFLTLFSKRKNLENFDSQSFLGILVSDLKGKYYFWGILTMGMKLILAYFVYGKERSAEVQICVSLLLIWCYQAMIRVFKPYKKDSLNSFQVKMTNLLMFNIIISKYFVHPRNGGFLNITFVVTNLVLNGGFLVILVLRMFPNLIKRGTRDLDRKSLRTEHLIEETNTVL